MNVITQKESFYRPLPETSPYSLGGRYDRTKEMHKFYVGKVRELIPNEVKKPLEVIDVGCGNGELLYVLKKEFPHWVLHGADPTPEFIATARQFGGLDGVTFEIAGIDTVAGQYDLVFCTGVLQIFTDIENALSDLLSVASPGGNVICDGLFNKWDVEVRLQYCDNSNPATAGLWRRDWNQHSRRGISSFLRDQVSHFEFYDTVMNADLPPNNDIHVNQFTFRDAQGENIITNGTNVMLNKTMLHIVK